MSLVEFSDGVCRLNSAVKMPNASGFLWNRRMMVHVNARGFVIAQYMQPEPTKYAHAPALEAKHFIQPEHPFFAHHPGRFVYVKDRDTGELFSLPHEPVRKALPGFVFEQTDTEINWYARPEGLETRFGFTLPADDVVELWSLNVRNSGQKRRNLSLFVYFPLGFMSWMNQSGHYDPELNAVVGVSVTAYQKLNDYWKNKDFKDQTYLISAVKPTAWESRQRAFEGEGGLNNPDMISAGTLEGGKALYEVPAAIMQFDVDLEPGESFDNRLLFGPAKDRAEIEAVSARYLGEEGYAKARASLKAYRDAGRGVLSVDAPDQHLSEFVNNWLPRQAHYHGDTNRLSTDPQTRNYLQDAMGAVYVKPEVARTALLMALSQQNVNGSMPDGIRLYEGAELKYINQVPHTDHCVWLSILLEAYLDETDDYGVLDVPVENPQSRQTLTVRERMAAAMLWLMGAVDERNLSLIDQGDWNDPMNMVGYKGKGVSGWLSLATAHALNLWGRIEENAGGNGERWFSAATVFNDAMNRHLWDGDWYGRGITDDNVIFGVKRDEEGRIYLNPQSFALLSGAADDDKKEKMLRSVVEQLETPYGVEMLGPPYTHMREDVGRLTQKYPGVTENGSVYNHAAIFFIYSLYQSGEAQMAFDTLRKMLCGPTEADYIKRGQLPSFIPNYYRGTFRQMPEVAGTSSQMFNTGTIAWVYRTVIEGLFGLKGSREGLRIAPQLPNDWTTAKATRLFRGAKIEVSYERGAAASITVNGDALSGNVLKVEAGKTYQVRVVI